MTRATVLLADDSTPVRSILRGHLQAGGFTVVEAVDGAQAIQLCRQASPDVILLDVDMPGMDGHLAIAIL
jgi:two-component system chemotaxis response regulator CheY